MFPVPSFELILVLLMPHKKKNSFLGRPYHLLGSLSSPPCPPLHPGSLSIMFHQVTFSVHSLQCTDHSPKLAVRLLTYLPIVYLSTLECKLPEDREPVLLICHCRPSIWCRGGPSSSLPDMANGKIRTHYKIIKLI